MVPDREHIHARPKQVDLKESESEQQPSARGGRGIIERTARDRFNFTCQLILWAGGVQPDREWASPERG
jgi:hypothetical protein